MEISLIENIQREDLNPIEEALAYQRLLTEFGLTQEEVAARVVKSRSAVTNSMRLLKLAKDVQDMLVAGELSAGHARALLALPTKKAQIEAANEIRVKQLSVRETEALVKKQQEQPAKKPAKESAAIGPIYQDLEEQLRRKLGTKVQIRGKEKKGMIAIEYYSRDELNRLIELLLQTAE